jgi:hypothetical protein
MIIQLVWIRVNEYFYFYTISPRASSRTATQYIFKIVGMDDILSEAKNLKMSRCARQDSQAMQPCYLEGEVGAHKRKSRRFTDQVERQTGQNQM